MVCAQGQDYTTKTKTKQPQQLNIAKKFETELKDANVSTNKGRSVKFDKSMSILAHFTHFKKASSKRVVENKRNGKQKKF